MDGSSYRSVTSRRIPVGRPHGTPPSATTTISGDVIMPWPASTSSYHRYVMQPFAGRLIMSLTILGISKVLDKLSNNNYFITPKADLATKSDQNYLDLKKEYNGKVIRVATYNNGPLSEVKRVNGTLIGGGVAFQIMHILRKKFNFTIEVVEPKKNYEFGGRSPEESLIGLLNSSKVDMAAAFLPTLIPYRKQVSFSVDLDEGVWMMMLKRPKESAGGSGLLAPFTEVVWYLVLVAVLTFGPCITFLSLLRTKLVPDHERVLKLEPSFWFVYSAFLKQGTSLAPEANTTRVLFVTWWLFMILLSAFYTANLTAFLTLSKFTLSIEKPKDLYDKNNRWVAPAGGSVEYTVKDSNDDLFYLSSMITTNRARFLSLKNDKDFLDSVKKGAVFIKEAAIIDHLMYNDYISKKDVEETDRCTFVIASNPFMKKQRAFAYPIGSKLKGLFDPVLLHIFQSGILDFLKRDGLPSTKICPLNLQSKDRKLRNSDLVMTYLAMATGTVAAVVAFIAEIILYRYIASKHDGVNKNKGKKLKLVTKRTQVQDDSRPPPYESLFGRNPKYNLRGSRTKIINGREYYVYVTGNGDTRLIPARAPSSLLYRSDK